MSLKAKKWWCKLKKIWDGILIKQEREILRKEMMMMMMMMMMQASNMAIKNRKLQISPSNFSWDFPFGLCRNGHHSNVEATLLRKFHLLKHHHGSSPVLYVEATPYSQLGIYFPMSQSTARVKISVWHIHLDKTVQRFRNSVNPHCFCARNLTTTAAHMPHFLSQWYSLKIPTIPSIYHPYWDVFF